MLTMTKPLQALTAGDLMNRDVVLLPEKMALRDAAQLLLQNQIGGAPVVDAQGRCIGVFSASDLLRVSARKTESARSAPVLPLTCSFQEKVTTQDGTAATGCLLPPGVCPIQVKQKGPHGEDLIVCSQPNCVLVDWQMVELEKLPADDVHRYMTPDPVTTQCDIGIRVLARMMIDAHIHRIIVVDEEQRPVGVVASTDILAAMANSEDH